MTENAREPRIGVLVVAYNAVTTLASVLDRIPQDFRERIAEIFVCDDASHDATHLVALGYQQTVPDLPLTVIRHEQNLGYGGNQKAGYDLAIEHDLDIIVLLHGDGQYAPERLASIVEPLVRGEADAVFGSRMMAEGGARRGGMPLYKYVSNRALTLVENLLIGSKLSEFHTGYRAFSRRVLEALPLLEGSDDFVFDNQILAQVAWLGEVIGEVSCPTSYAPEASSISFSRSVRYGFGCLATAASFRLAKWGWLRSRRFP